MNIAVGTTGCKYLAPTDRTDIFVGRVGSDLAAQAQDRVHHIAANARSQNVFGNCCEDCTHSFKTDRSSSLDFENCWRWLVLAPSGPGQLEEMNSYCCVFTAKTWRLCRTTVSRGTCATASKLPHHELTANPFGSETNPKDASNAAEFVS
jgi:hypothetical protein